MSLSSPPLSLKTLTHSLSLSLCLSSSRQLVRLHRCLILMQMAQWVLATLMAHGVLEQWRHKGRCCMQGLHGQHG